MGNVYRFPDGAQLLVESPADRVAEFLVSALEDIGLEVAVTGDLDCTYIGVRNASKDVVKITVEDVIQ